MPASPSLSAISIRRAAHNDAPEILGCLRAAFAPYRDFYTPDAYLDTVLTPESLQDRLASMEVFVAQILSGQIVGTVACQATSQGEGHLRGMAVLPACQGTGIAAHLLTHVEAELRRQNCARITLDTTAPLQRAMRFYEKFGFRRSGRVPHPCGLCKGGSFLFVSPSNFLGREGRGSLSFLRAYPSLKARRIEPPPRRTP